MSNGLGITAIAATALIAAATSGVRGGDYSATAQADQSGRNTSAASRWWWSVQRAAARALRGPGRLRRRRGSVFTVSKSRALEQETSANDA